MTGAAPSPWPSAETLAAVGRVVLAPGAVTDGFQGIDVREEDGRLLTEFRWRMDPNAYVVAFAFPEDATSPWTGLPVDDAQEWAQEIAFLLMEELDTGLVARARRSQRGDAVELAVHDVPGDVLGPEFYLGEVLPENDWIVAEAGLNPAVPQQSRRDGRLISWLAVHPNTRRFHPLVAHGSVSWLPGQSGVASLDLLEAAPGEASHVVGGLAKTLVFLAAYAGASTVVASHSAEELAALGFTPANNQTWSVPTLGFGVTSRP